MKINIIGTTASGKSTFGRRLAEILSVSFIEMDLIFWGPNWAKPTDEEYFKKIEIATSAASWVLDGNYTRTTPIKWKNVDLVIWLDYGFCRTFYQSVTRATNRAYNRTELWPNTGNYESFGRMFSKESIIWWCVKNYSKNKTRYKEVMRNPDYSHIKFVHIKSPGQAEQYLVSCSQRTKNGYNKAL